MDGLVEHDLVERQRDESDERHVIITLTPHGEHILQHLALSHQTELQSYRTHASASPGNHSCARAEMPKVRSLMLKKGKVETHGKREPERF